MFTFDFEAPGAFMLLDYDGTSIRIHGVAFGGLDVGTEYDPVIRSFVELDFTYDVVISAPGDDDLIVVVPDHRGRRLLDCVIGVVGGVGLVGRLEHAQVVITVAKADHAFETKQLF